jgi:hypothetical protein
MWYPVFAPPPEFCCLCVSLPLSGYLAGCFFFNNPRVGYFPGKTVQTALFFTDINIKFLRSLETVTPKNKLPVMNKGRLSNNRLITAFPPVGLLARWVSKKIKNQLAGY